MIRSVQVFLDRGRSWLQSGYKFGCPEMLLFFEVRALPSSIFSEDIANTWMQPTLKYFVFQVEEGCRKIVAM